MANIIVTGGCGFIGSNLVSMLKDKGHAVTIVDNFSKGSVRYLDDASSYQIVEADVRDQQGLTTAFKGHDAIIHLAAYGSVVESVDSPEENFSINAQGTFNVLNAARFNNINQVIFSSTGGALIGNATPPVSEQSVPRPISPYGASKLAGEGYCCAFANSYDMSIKALRFANVIGPISWHKKGAVTAFYKAILNNEPLRIFGDGSATRDFLHVKDLCNGIVAGMEAGLEGFNVFHLASGREVSVRELAEIACNTASELDPVIHFEQKRKGEVEKNFADYSLAKEILNFTPEYSLQEAMQETWEWFKNYHDQVQTSQ